MYTHGVATTWATPRGKAPSRPHGGDFRQGGRMVLHLAKTKPRCESTRLDLAPRSTIPRVLSSWGSKSLRQPTTRGQRCVTTAPPTFGVGGLSSADSTRALGRATRWQRPSRSLSLLGLAPCSRLQGSGDNPVHELHVGAMTQSNNMVDNNEISGAACRQHF